VRLEIAGLLGLGVLFIFCLVILIVLLRRRGGDTGSVLTMVEKNQQRLEKAVREEIAANRRETADSAQQARSEASRSLHEFGTSIARQMSVIARLQKQQLQSVVEQLSQLTESNEQRVEKLRLSVEQKLESIRGENAKKLEEMRATVDEKLHSTLEKRLGDSFRLVSERLEQVHKGLGEMQELATGVGDLKRVLTNVKARGTWAEVQLGALLEETLTPDQYAVNVATRTGSAERVEFAIKLPGRHLEDRKPVWLPIDAKFPREDYEQLLDAREQGDAEKAAQASRQLEGRIKAEGKAIHDKYLDPPNTTDFGIMFLPVEGLFAEVIRRPGLVDHLQRASRIVVTGPTTLTALLNSLQMGFRTLAIERRSSEVWATLSAVKTEFGKFGDILDKTKKKLQEATHSIDNASRKTRTIERRLKDVEVLPGPENPVPENNGSSPHAEAAGAHATGVLGPGFDGGGGS
jgi:DNA recombination protein RmuC